MKTLACSLAIILVAAPFGLMLAIGIVLYAMSLQEGP